MKNNDILFLADALQEVNAPDMDPDFNYAVSHNLRETEKIAQDISKAIEAGEDFNKYEKKINEIRIKFAEKDEKTGEPIKTVTPIPGGTQITYKVPGAENPASQFNKALDKCREEFKEVIEKRNKQLEFLKKDNTDLKLMMVDQELIPRGLSRVAMNAVYLMTIPKK